MTVTNPVDAACRHHTVDSPFCQPHQINRSNTVCSRVINLAVSHKSSGVEPTELQLVRGGPEDGCRVMLGPTSMNARTWATAGDTAQRLTMAA